MKIGRAAVAALIGAAVIVAGVAITGFAITSNGSKSTQTAQNKDKSLAASVRTQIEKPLTLAKGEVKNLKKVSDDPDHLSLTWDSVPEAIGYNIYLCDKDGDNSFHKIAAIKNTSADLQNLQSSNVYWIKVAACVREGGKTLECPATLLKTATKVDEVKGLDIQHSGDVLGFTWTPNPKLDGYEIYRATKSNGGQFSLYETISGKVGEYNDEDVEGGELYSYKIRPFRETGGERFGTDGEVIDLVSGLSSPSGLVGRTANNRVVLYWQDRQYASGYNVFMAKGKDGEFQQVDTTTENTYSSDKLETDAVYYFRVQPFRKVDDRVIEGTWSTTDVKVKSSSGGSTISGKGTYIEISIDQQHMWFYEDGKLVLDTSVVTGNADGEHNTPPGSYAIQDHAMNVTLIGDDYETPVTYWMGFNGGIGIHDADWRSSFGGDIYEGNGSHGCVNTPYEKVKVIFEHTEVGTPVYVY